MIRWTITYYVAKNVQIVNSASIFMMFAIKIASLLPVRKNKYSLTYVPAEGFAKDFLEGIDFSEGNVIYF